MAGKKLSDVAQTAPDTVVLASDQTSLYLQATTMAVWAPRGQTPVVRTDPGRSKVNFYGTLNLRTGQETVMRAPVMNNEATALHLQQLLATYPEGPILLLWDRAPWHAGPAVTSVLQAHPRLEVVRLPVAAPELNPQEHVWKATRRAVSHNHQFQRLPELADRFEQHLTSNLFACSLLDPHAFETMCLMFK
jgi:transposase